MSDVSTYEVQQQLRSIERRVETLERFHTAELERRQRRDELTAKLWFGAMILFGVIAWTVIITVEIVEKK